MKEIMNPLKLTFIVFSHLSGICVEVEMIAKISDE